MAAKEQRKQQLIFFVAVLVILFAAMSAGLYFGGVRIGSFGESGAQGGAETERYATLTDAQMLCEARAREVFESRIRTLVVDAHSTRLDKKAKVFRVFMEADLYANSTRTGPTIRHFINCFTRTDRVAIASFQFAKDGEPMKDPGGSLFGF